MRSKFILLIFSALFISGCGHNVLSDYEVRGLDLSFPIFGYPFGLRIGAVKVNANAIRGNSTYTIHSNTGVDVASKNSQRNSVIQFSSNTQINEGNIESILTSSNLDDKIKGKFITEYLPTQNAPKVLPVSSRTALTNSVSGEDPQIHLLEIKSKETKSFSEKMVSSIVSSSLNLFSKSSTGKYFISIAKYISLIIILLFIYDILKKLAGLFKKSK